MSTSFLADVQSATFFECPNYGPGAARGKNGRIRPAVRCSAGSGPSVLLDADEKLWTCLQLFSEK